MSTDEVLAEIEERGLEIHLAGDDILLITGDPKEITPALLNVIPWHKDNILKRLREKAALKRKAKGGAT